MNSFNKKRRMCAKQCKLVRVMAMEEPEKPGLNSAAYDHFSELWDKYGWLEWRSTEGCFA